MKTTSDKSRQGLAAKLSVLAFGAALATQVMAATLEPPVITMIDGQAVTAPAPTGAVVPLSWSDPVFSSVAGSGPVNLSASTVLSNLSIIDSSGNPSVNFNGGGTINNVRMQTREGPRCMSGNMNINWTWIDVYKVGDDHADGLQCYAPGSTGTVTVKNTTFYARGGAHTAYFSADSWKGAHVFENVLFWGDGTASFGLRLNVDGGSSVRMKNVYFVKGSVGIPYQIDIPIAQWENVRWATVQSGKLVPGDLIPQPK